MPVNSGEAHNQRLTLMTERSYSGTEGDLNESTYQK